MIKLTFRRDPVEVSDDRWNRYVFAGCFSPRCLGTGSFLSYVGAWGQHVGLCIFGHEGGWKQSNGGEEPGFKKNVKVFVFAAG